MRKTLTLIALVIAGFAGYYVCRAGDLYFNQDRYVYHPERDWVATPGSLGLPFEDVELTASDGIRLSSWYIPSDPAKGTVLVLHGNARNMSSDLDVVGMLHGFGYNVLILDYRGFGKSEGRPSGIVIFGRSLGAAVGAELVEIGGPHKGGY